MHCSASAPNGAAITRRPPRLTYPMACCPITSAHTRTQSPQTMHRSAAPAAPETLNRGGGVEAVLPGQIVQRLHVGAAGQEELQDHPAQLPHPFVGRLHHVAGGGDVDAGRDHPGPLALLDLHDADPARPIGGDGRMVAERGDCDAEAPGNAEHRLVGESLGLAAVDRDHPGGAGICFAHIVSLTKQLRSRRTGTCRGRRRTLCSPPGRSRAPSSSPRRSPPGGTSVRRPCSRCRRPEGSGR